MKSGPTQGSLPLASHAAIRAVILRYATAIDTRDWALFESCFDPELATDFGAIGSWSDRRGFVRRMEEGHLQYGKTLHRITNIVICGEAESDVRVTSYIDAVLMPLDDQGFVRRACGSYHDVFVLAGGRWLIRSRRYEPVLTVDRVLGSGTEL